MIRITRKIIIGFILVFILVSSPLLIVEATELPKWSIGDSYVYSDVNFKFEYPKILTIQGAIKNVKLVVVDVDEVASEYTLNITGNIDISQSIFTISAGKYSGNIMGVAHINISTLAIKDFVFLCSGKFSLFRTNINVSIPFVYMPIVLRRILQNINLSHWQQQVSFFYFNKEIISPPGGLSSL